MPPSLFALLLGASALAHRLLHLGPE
jgi:hypothetical protein